MIVSLRSSKAVRAFRKAHGDVATWGAVDYEVHQNLALIALAAKDASRLGVAKRRLRVVAIVAYATPLYVLHEVLSARGRTCNWLEHHLDWVDDRLDDAEHACKRSGDQEFAARVADALEPLEDAVDRMTARLSKE